MEDRYCSIYKETAPYFLLRSKLSGSGPLGRSTIFKNFRWSDPKLGGDNSLVPVALNWDAIEGLEQLSPGMLGSFCGTLELQGEEIKQVIGGELFHEGSVVKVRSYEKINGVITYENIRDFKGNCDFYWEYKRSNQTT